MMEPVAFDIRRGDIYYADLRYEPIEQRHGIRPVIIVSNDMGNFHADSVIVVQLTSKRKKQLPTHVFVGQEVGLKCDSTAKCEALMTIDKSKLLRFIGSLNGTRYEIPLDLAIKISLGLE